MKHLVDTGSARGDTNVVDDESACFVLRMREDVQNPSDVRAAILAEHAEIRTLMQRLERNVRRMKARGGAVARDLQMNRDAARKLCFRVLAHMATEERLLVPVLERLDAWGSVRADRLVAEHAQQRALIRAWLGALDGNTEGSSQIRALVQSLLAHLRRDMQEEEELHLSSDVLVDVDMPSAVEAG